MATPVTWSRHRVLQGATIEACQEKGHMHSHTHSQETSKVLWENAIRNLTSF